jgi:hypothetical protein
MLGQFVSTGTIIKIIPIAVAMKIELESALYFLSFLHVNKNK